MPDTVTTDLTALALSRLKELRERMKNRADYDMALLDGAVRLLEVIQDDPPPPRKVTGYVNIYTGGMGSEVFSNAEVAKRAARNYGYRTFGTYLYTLPVVAELPPR